jgi:hypothetical protein
MQSLTPDFLAALRYDGLQLATLRTRESTKASSNSTPRSLLKHSPICGRLPSSNPPSRRTAWKALWLRLGA